MSTVKKAWFIGDNTITMSLPGLEGRPAALKDMYPIIGNGCHTVELVQLKKGVEMWVDEEGLLKENTLNHLASHMAGRPIVGNAIVIDNTKSGDYIPNAYL